MAGDVVLPVFNDHAGTIWMGIAGKGINRLENSQIQTITPDDGLPDQLVLTLCEDLANSLWIGTAGGGMTHYKNKKFTTYSTSDGLSNNVVSALYCDKSGILWAGTTGGGINRFENFKFTAYTTKEGLSDDNVTSILEDMNGILWVGTNDGLNGITGGKISVIDIKHGLSDDYILSLYEDRAGNLWVGTARNGFNLIRNGKIKQFTTQDGLINEAVLNILEDDFGYLWISCNKGIYKAQKQELLDFADSKRSTFTTYSYGRTEGMETIECNGGIFPPGCKTKDGRLWFPTMNGVSIIDPALMKSATSYFSPVFIEDFFVDGRPVQLTSPLAIPSYSNRLEFRYSALNFTNPEKIKYRCMLAGFDREWVECGTQRSAYYTNIPGGQYTFKVMAANESGEWSENCTELVFRLKIPLNKSILFKTLRVIFSLLLIILIVYYFLERLKRAQLNLLVEERTNELNRKMNILIQIQQELEKANIDLIIAKEQAESGIRLKTAFIHNISHEIRTPLNGIVGFSNLISQPDITDQERTLYYSQICKGTDRLLKTITNYMDASLIISNNIVVNKKNFELMPFMDTLLQEFHSLCEAKNITLQADIPDCHARLVLISDAYILKKVLSQLLDNALKFTTVGCIATGFKINEDSINFFVKDTGMGIKPGVLPRIFEGFMQEELLNSGEYHGTGLGLTIAQGFVKLLGGEIHVKSTKGVGSIFSFELPNPRQPIPE